MTFSTLIEDETILHTTTTGTMYRIQFHHDYDAQNPWEWCDGMVPLSVLVGRGHEIDHSGEYDILDPLCQMPEAWITRNRFEISRILDMGFGDVATLDSAIRDEQYHYSDPISDVRIEYFQEHLSGMYTSDKYESIAAIWRLRGIPAQVRSTQGYSQGDYSELLFVAHPDFVRDMGFRNMRDYIKRCGSDFDSEVNQYGAWCWGGVIGYVAERIDPEELRETFAAHNCTIEKPHDTALNELELCEDVDSCWGFFPDHDQDYFPLQRNHAYAISEAISACEYDAKAIQRGRAERLKAMIRSGAPLYVRATSMNEVTV